MVAGRVGSSSEGDKVRYQMEPQLSTAVVNSVHENESNRTLEKINN